MNCLAPDLQATQQPRTTAKTFPDVLRLAVKDTAVFPF
jgi:hypothetical protein